MNGGLLRPPAVRRSRRLALRAAFAAAALLAVYLITAYVALPLAWLGYERRHPALDDLPGVTMAADRSPGDPLNVALVGTEHGLKRAMLGAGWHPADPLTFESCLEIASATVLRRPYDDAPVSSLYLWGRKEDLAFEQPVGDSPRKRHHVRFWRSSQVDGDGRPLWVGSVTYDERVGFSDTTGQITHHIAPDVDRERDRLFEELERVGAVAEVESVPDFHQVRSGRNGGGDPWRTDGALFVGTLVPR